MSYYINENCTGCTACARNCPVDAIFGLLKHQHKINNHRCIDCNVCANTCNFNAVVLPNGKIAKPLSHKQWLKPKIDNNQCSACNICVRTCPFECLEITEPAFKGDYHVHAFLKHPNKCVGCKICFNDCPMQAIKMIEGEII